MRYLSIRLIRGLNSLFVEIARRLRRRFQERLVLILLVKRLDRDRAAAQQVKHSPASRIRQRAEGRLWRICNRSVPHNV